MFGKRGQEGITLGTLLLIILGVVVVVVIIMGATGGLTFVFEKINLAPGQSLEAKTQSCIIAAKSNLRADYCNEYAKVKIAGEGQYVNCEFPTVKTNVEQEVTPTFTCAESSIKPSEYCIQLIKAGKADENTMVNNVRCAGTIICGDGGLNGVLPENGKCTAQGTRKIVKGFIDASKGCCVA